MNQEMDVAREPVDISSEDDQEFMDTGVLHENRVCTNCQKRSAKAGHTMCSSCMAIEG